MSAGYSMLRIVFVVEVMRGYCARCGEYRSDGDLDP